MAAKSKKSTTIDPALLARVPWFEQYPDAFDFCIEQVSALQDNGYHVSWDTLHQIISEKFPGVADLVTSNAMRLKIMKTLTQLRRSSK